MNKVSLSIKEYLALYAAFARVTFLTQLEYRGQYFVRMLSKMVLWLYYNSDHVESVQRNGKLDQV